MTAKMNSALAVAAMLLLITVCGTTVADLSDGLMTHWEFDEMQGDIAYDSVGNNDGTIYEATWTSGQIDGALHFDGDFDYVDFGDIDEFEFGDSNYAISAWFYSEGSHGSELGCIVSKYNYVNLGRQWEISQIRDTGVLRFYTSPNGSTHEDLSSTGGDYYDRWVHVAGVREGSTKYLYVDGQLDNTGSTQGVVTGKSSNVYVGCWENDISQTRFFNGKIDDVRIYDRALSDEEVFSLYEAAVDPYQIAIAGILDAIAQKEQLLLDVDAAIEREQVAYDALEELLAGGDYAGLRTHDIIKAQQKIHSAIQHEQQSKDALEKSIEKLYDALYALAWEPPVADGLTSEL